MWWNTETKLLLTLQLPTVKTEASQLHSYTLLSSTYRVEIFIFYQNNASINLQKIIRMEGFWYVLNMNWHGIDSS